MKVIDAPVSRLTVAGETADPRQDLVQRVASSTTFGKSPRLRAFLLHVCQCALDNQPEAATEQQIGIHVFGRPAGYNPNEDNIVRSQARLLRLKLEHHFAHEGRDEPVVITIPKGRYLPAFEQRPEPPMPAPPPPAIPAIPEPRLKLRTLMFLASAAVLVGISIWFGASLFRSKGSRTPASRPDANDANRPYRANPAAAAPISDEVRIAAGNMGGPWGPFTDRRGRRWEADRYYEGGVARAGTAVLFPPPPDAGLLRTMREGESVEFDAPRSKREFRYSIPVRPGVYELRLYFADPVRGTETDTREDAQNDRHFSINYNGRPLLTNFDPTTDSGYATVDVRAFRDITPAADGNIHLEFLPGPERPFINALELTPGIPGRMKPIRLCARNSEVVDSDGTRWSGDNYFIHGRSVFMNPVLGPKLPALYAGERYGNFSYAIPVPPGSYTVKLHFLESFFGPLNPGTCRGADCRVFDVTCNGVALLRDFDISKAASAPLQPVIRTFKGLRPNGQGKLLLSFLPKVNYAEVRAIEVIDEAK